MILIIALLTQSSAWATAARVLDGATITNSGAVLTLPTTTDTMVGRATTDTLTNKTLTAPSITSPTGITKSDVDLSNVDNTSDATKNAATATLTNKTLTAPVINSPTGITKSDVGLSNVDNTSDATKNAATATLTNKTMDYNSNTFQNFPSAAPIVTGTRAAPTAITAAGGISFSGSNPENLAFIKGNAAPITVTASPQIAAGNVVGQILVLVARDATNTLTLSDGTGLSLNGAWIGGLDSSLTLNWDGTNWSELNRR